MAQALVHRVGSQFKAWISVQANPNATITATGGGKQFTAVADSVTGIATILVKKKATYTLTTDCPAAYDANGNTAAVIVNKSKETYTAQLVKLNRGFSNLYVSNQYKSGTLLVYWNGSKPNSYCANYYLESLTDKQGLYTGTGSSYVLSASATVNGYLQNVSAGTTKQYKLSAFITINGKNYHESGLIASGTAANLSETGTISFGSSQNWTIPAGVRRITVCCIGGGGSGGAGVTRSAGGGGGGGYLATKTFNVTPGQVASLVIGGSNGNTTFSINGDSVTGSAGGAGANATNTGGGNGGNGGSGGGGGGYRATSDTVIYSSGGKGGSNGGNGSSTTNGKNGTGGSGRGESAVTFNGVIYSGGGGGGRPYWDDCSYGAGGNRGGGKGGSYYKVYSTAYGINGDNGAAGTGGGGGGGGCANAGGGAGGSGAIIINYAA